MSKAERKRRARAGIGKRGSGVMRGMRGGFKNIASNVTGEATSDTKKKSWMGTAVTVLLLAAIAAFAYYRFFA